MESLDLTPIRQGWGTAQAGKSVEGKTLRLAGLAYEHGVGSHASGAVYVELDGQAQRFQAIVGVDDETRDRGSVTLKAYGDTKLLLTTEVLKGGQAPLTVDLDIAGVKRLIMVMGDGGDGMHYDHLDFADARFLVEGGDPKIIPRPREEAVMLTPKPPKEPRVNGPKVYGVRPGSPFLYRIPATGEHPMRFAVEGLPAGLALDAATGIVSGRIEDPAPQTYQTKLVAENALGSASREFRIVVGDTLALTPPMGWNHWYAHYDRVTDIMMREAADVMVNSGMADVGYQYVNIDD
jgi:alpha-galactosidase